MLNNFGFYILNIYLLRQYMCVYYNSIPSYYIMYLCLVLIISKLYDMFVFSSQNAYIDIHDIL